MGPTVCSGLKSKFKGDVACQGVGGAYSAGLMDNVSASGTSAGAISEALKMFTTAHSKCPNSIIVAGGYRYVYKIYGWILLTCTPAKEPQSWKTRSRS
jgi:cutinase